MSESIYLDDYSDEVMPCKPTLEGYAAFLSSGGTKDWPTEVPADGSVFKGRVLVYKDDIIATRKNGEWSLSRDPANDDDFVAVRSGPGLGWWPDMIIIQEVELFEGTYRNAETMAEALIRWLQENDDDMNDIEYVAVGQNQDGLLFEYRSNPPRLIKVTSQ